MFITESTTYKLFLRKWEYLISDFYPPQNPEYEENYNTLPEDQSSGGYDTTVSDPWRTPYITQDPSYFGPQLTTAPLQKDPGKDFSNI